MELPTEAERLIGEKRHRMLQIGAPLDQIDQYLLVTVTVALHGAPRESLLIERSQTFRELSRRITEIVRRHVPKKGRSAFQGVFLSLDDEGLRAPGQLDGPIGNQVVDGQMLYLSFLLAKGRWQKSAIPEPKTQDCHHCRKPFEAFRSFRAYVGYQTVVLCFDCMSPSLRLGSGSPIPEQLASSIKHRYPCFTCGRSSPALKVNNQLSMLVGACPGRCEGPPLQKACNYCGIPLAHRSLCGRCKQASYCSSDCQKKDWPQHKGHCSA